ncbi:Detected protein of unknown function [Hibiscus syriacus]|uniref:Uncharacterized protein n=1 Tax=Hibiscus syriacus TaxID=106335 RepID=A0A6A3BJ81_HIBSY|nr:Detected protein of unknown function [Hibiscus syriacus]
MIAQFLAFEESNYVGNPLLCGKPLSRNCSTSEPSLPSLLKGSTEDGLIDMTEFYASFVASYVVVILSIASVLYINPYWRRACQSLDVLFSSIAGKISNSSPIVAPFTTPHAPSCSLCRFESAGVNLGLRRWRCVRRWSSQRFGRVEIELSAIQKFEPIFVQETLQIVRQLDPALLDQLNHVCQYSPVHVQSDQAGHLVISGEPRELSNPWGVTPFKKVVSLPSRINPYATAAVVTLQGQLFVHAPFEPTGVV